MRSNDLPARRAVFFAACWLLAVSWQAKPVEPIPPADDAPKPLAPAESLTRFRLPNDLRIELVAAEPLLAEPTGIAFDARGRLFVSELHGYNLNGYLDIVELNKTGVLDRQIRRIRASPEASAAAKKATYGTVKLLVDSRDDGKFDKAIVWADHLPPCYGVVPARDGLIAVCPPDIIYLADRDGDGKHIVRETLFTGFGHRVIERGINNPRWGLDNWIYVAAGGGGGTITGPRLAQPVSIGHTDFRIKADGSAIEPVTGVTGTFGQTFTDFGARFNSGPGHAQYAIPLPYRYLARNPYAAGPVVTARAASYDRVYPISQSDPWRRERGRDPAWVKFYGARETAGGSFTSQCGPLIYRADLLPERYRGNHFSCEPAQNLVHRCLLQRDGLHFYAGRAPGEEKAEFLSSTDQWFRPINLHLGPDGALYVVDMYREIIEDYSAIPRHLQQRYVQGLINGKDRGRIWRIVPRDLRDGAPSAHAPVGKANTNELVKELASGNAWRRETAQRVLIERADPAAGSPLRRLAREGHTPQARVHALCTLDGMQDLAPADVQNGLADPSFAVRMHSLRLGERWLSTNVALRDQALRLIADPDAAVRLQAALSLGEVHDGHAIAALSRLASSEGQDAWMRAGILSSVAGSADELIAQLLRDGKPSPGAISLLRPLASTIGARRETGQIVRLVNAIAGTTAGTHGPTPDVPEQVALLEGLAEGLGRGKTTGLKLTDAVPPIEQLLKSPAPLVRQRTVRVAGLLRTTDSPALRQFWKIAAPVALDANRSVPDRVAAVELLGAAPWSDRLALAPLLDARQPADVQLAVVDALSTGEAADAARLLLSRWPGLSPWVQERIMDALFASRDRLLPLLEALETKQVATAGVSSLRRAQLLENSNQEIQGRARKLFAGPSTGDRAAVLQRYATALTLPRDAQKGRTLFEKHCTICHRLHGQGFEVGPDLSTARGRADATILSDILDPSSVIEPGFTAYVITTQNGRVFSGVLAAETATSVTLRRDKGQTDTVLRKDVEDMKVLTRSLMPDGLEKQLAPQDLADVIGYLRESTPPVPPPASGVSKPAAPLPKR